MAKKPTITTISSGFSSSTTTNNNFTILRDAFENFLSLDGETPNAMEADFDLGNNDILNGGAASFDSLTIAGTNFVPSTAASIPDWEGAWVTSTAYVLNDLAREDGSTYICTEAHTSGTFSTDLSASKWELFAQKGAAGAGSGDMIAANNLSDVSNAATSLSNIGGAAASHTHLIADLPEATTAQVLSNTADKVMSTDQTWGALGTVSLTDASTVSVDMSLGINFTVTLGGNRTLGFPTNPKVGQSGYFEVTQDGTGSRTLAYGTGYQAAGGAAPTLTTTASAVDYVHYVVTSATTILITTSLNVSNV